MKPALLIPVCLLMAATLHAEEVRETKVMTHEVTKIRIARGTVALPNHGYWEIGHVESDSWLSEIFLEPSSPPAIDLMSVRKGRLEDRRAIRARGQALRQLYWAADRYARDEGDGLGPKVLESLSESRPWRDGPYLRNHDTIAGVHWLGQKRLFDAIDRRTKPEKVELLAFDTTPAIDDGKHWILNNHGVTERIAVDAELLKQHRLSLRPREQPAEERVRERAPVKDYHLFAKVSGEPHGNITIPMHNLITREERSMRWNAEDWQESEEPLAKEWAQIRAQALGRSFESPLANHWRRQWQRQYDLDPEALGLPSARNRDPNAGTATTMNVLGGRAAVRETLQMQDLIVSSETSKGERLAIAKVKGVEVQSHPFDEMLAESPEPKPSLALAEWVPHDRFLLYLPDPSSVFSMLDGGATFLHNTSVQVTSRKVAYHLKNRYLARLGISETLLEQFLNTGVIAEMAVILPDLFLIDGTDVTVVMRTTSPLLTAAGLRLLGVRLQDGRASITNASGQIVVWQMLDDHLLVSTHPDEITATIAASTSETGLGKSDEFRYMLGQVPVTETTRVYAYFSDPFIRRLVGPAVKIGQRRRLAARVRLEQASAAALSAQWDGYQERRVDALINRKYLPATFAQPDTITINEDYVSMSDTYGTVNAMATLLQNPVTDVSPEEKTAYDQYLNRYNRFWRRYFDPIAIRYECTEDSHQVETFILPLIDSSLYNGLKEVLTPESEGTPLHRPLLTPEPIAMLSLNLNEEAWLDMIDDFGPLSLLPIVGMNGGILDLLGPDFHMAIHDADPVVAVGSGELSELLGRFGGRVGSEMTMISGLVSILTRPTTLLLGIQDPDKMRQQLKRLAVQSDPQGQRSLGFAATISQLTGQDKWLLKLTAEGLLSLRFGLEVQNRYLVVTNLPLSMDVQVTGHRETPNRAVALSLAPRACVSQLPALFASAVENDRSSASASAHCLKPFLMTPLINDVRDAQAWHYRLFGFEPQHPGGGHWQWENSHLISSLYGPPWAAQQPPFDPDNRHVGLLRRVADVDLSMQFEEDGLRSLVRWSLKEASPPLDN